MAAAMIVADYIIDKAKKLNKPISNLQLQKIMFFLNVQHLLEHKTSLITDNKFEKWSYGPVIKQVYRQYSSYGSNPIDKVPAFKFMIQNDEKFDLQVYEFKESDLEKQHRDFIDKYIDLFLDKPVFKLVNESHKDPQWQDKSQMYYDDKRLIEYYSKNKFW